MSERGDARRAPSKTLATWLAVVVGALGGHRFYLFGAADPLGWLHAALALAGAWGAARMRAFGTDDRLGSVLVPLLGASIAVAMLAAIVYGLASEARWHARFGGDADGGSNWPTVLGVVIALAVGATATMATIAFVAQRYFEWSGAR